MCGICGFIYPKSLKLNSSKTITRMADKIFHRGPDDYGAYTDENVALGFQRLSIIDIETGQQPMSNTENSVIIVFNGEIYNYLELRKKLINLGFKFKTTSDTEVVLNLYIYYGEKCVDYLRGMFAFSIWDKYKRKLFCARDRFGIKPFYYAQTNEIFCFGSEIKSIATLEDVNLQLDPLALDMYLAYGYIGANRTIYKSIKKLLPGHTLTIDVLKSKEPIIKKYWDIKITPDYHKTESDWIEELDELFSETIKMHLISDVPLGAFLSGGIDSSAVVAYMSKFTNQPVKTFSIGFQEEKYNELPYARQIAGIFNTDHHEMIVEPESIDILPTILNGFDEPFSDASAIPTYFLSKFTKEYVTVALSGDGGDELFAGYNTYPRLLNFHNFNIMPEKFNKIFWGSIDKIYPNNIFGKGFINRMSHNKNSIGSYFSTKIKQSERCKYYNPNLSYDMNNYCAEQYKMDILEKMETKDFLSRMQKLDMKTYMVDDILTKVDRMSMLNSLEVRVPILDHKFAELSYRIPSKLKLNKNIQKYIFKETSKKYLPKNILHRKKQGFSVPLELWFKQDLKDYINDRLMNSNSKIHTILNPYQIKKLVESNKFSLRSQHREIWTILVLDNWLELNRCELP